MLKFFRRIRQKLIEKGNLKRYMVYAIGEILLVMIGILLALQVNNWNETKKERKKETKLLSQLKSDLNYNLDEIKSLYKGILIRSVAKDSIVSYLADVEIHTEELKMYLHQIQLSGIFNLANTTYKSIEAGGIDALSNDALRAKITDMYEFHFRNVEERTKLEYDIITYRLKPIILIHFIPTQISKLHSDKSIMKDVEILNFPKDAIELRDNNQFINVLTELQGMTTARKFMQEQTITNLEELIIEVEEEIKRLKK